MLPVLFSVVLLPGQAQHDVRVNYEKHEYRIPMRDGVRLFTTVYSPRDHSVSYPILFTRTPYGVRPYGPDEYSKSLGPSPAFAADGFIFVFQDVRGRYMSEGTWEEMRPEKDKPNGTDESTDCYDSVDWLIKNLPNNNGKVGLIGISYPGFYAEAGMISSHPAVVAASPQAPVTDLYMGDDAYHNGAFFLLANFEFYSLFNRQNNPVLPDPEKPFPYGTEDGYRFFLQMGSVKNANDRYFHRGNPYWTEVVDHTDYDAFWKARNISRHLRNIRPAVLIVGGWFDAEDLAGTLKSYAAIRTQSPETSVQLVMGPWTHGGWARSKGDKLGDIDFGSNTSQYYQDQIELPFFLHYLKGAPDPNLPAAYVFQTGRNSWQRESSWPPAHATKKRLYLEAAKSLSWEPPGASTGFDEYVSDPQHPVPFFDRPTLEPEPTYMDADQRFVMHRRDVLIYQTPPLTEEVTVSGPVSPCLAISSTGTDSDFVVKLIDVYPPDADLGLAGYEQLVRGEPFRAKFRNSFEHPERLVPGEISLIRYSMPDVNHCFLRGHRIMVQIQSSWFPLVDRNPQTFTNIPYAKASDFVKATERIYRSADHPSFIELSVER
ncbi:MAG: CocE/NonD family hydrolase [Acidobacteriaceae bacterium]|nr:CocE/NonD family hydrolase [Acidobacteriaceae bacterium]